MSKRNYLHSFSARLTLILFLLVFGLGPVLLWTGVVPIRHLISSPNKASEKPRLTSPDDDFGPYSGDDEWSEGSLDADSPSAQKKKKKRPAGSRRRISSSKKAWKRFRVEREVETSNRIVAGRKESVSFEVRLEPKGYELPNQKQLAKISQDLRSADHHVTFVHFYLPGMSTKLGAWATAHHTLNKPFKVKLNETYVPKKYQ